MVKKKIIINKLSITFSSLKTPKTHDTCNIKNKNEITKEKSKTLD